MRVISGKAKSLKLKTIDSDKTRPTTDRTKETLFNMMQGYIPCRRFLDLFSGSGAIGIEALSRGSQEAVFIEHNVKAIKCIRENLRFTHLEDQAQILVGDVLKEIKELRGTEPFSCIFMDPPYNKGLEREVLEILSIENLLEEDGICVVEASLETNFSYLDSLGFEVVKERKYKSNQHIFLKKKREEDL
ncbi:MAG TPA: 16S rRNA (guanine(966)-N(2))-methyltransferase RsmD [Lachnospiraceae bacterium]